jgi:endonuclease-3
MSRFDIDRVILALEHAAREWPLPSVTLVAQEGADPFKVLVSCLLSLRTRDAVTAAASSRLFAVASTPAAIAGLSVEEISALIFPVGFYHTKAGRLKEVSQRLVDEFAGRVPSSLDQLLSFAGVGRKTANLVVTLGFGLPGICVDIHVHRICNRWGYVRTKTPDETEWALRATLPTRYWLRINDLLVAFGQNLCHPVSPLCSKCPVVSECARVNVKKNR